MKVLKFFIYNEKGDWNEKMNSDLFPLLDKDIEIFHWDSFQKKRSELEELNKTQYKGLLWSPHGGYPKLFFIAGTDYRGKSFKSDFDKLFKKGNIEEFARIINKNARDVTSTFLLERRSPDRCLIYSDNYIVFLLYEEAMQLPE